MKTTSHHEAAPPPGPPRHPSIAASAIFLTLLLAPTLAHAQLPAGTTDTTAPPNAAPQDPQRAEANEALGHHDYATAARLLSALAEKSPNDAHLLYDLGFSQDALDQTSAAEDSYRRAIAADPSYFDPHLALGLLLARSGKLNTAHTELLKATTLQTDNPLLKARAYRALARIDQSSSRSTASDELLQAMKLSPETPDDILLSGELAEAAGDPAAAEAAYRRLLAADPHNDDANAALIHLLLNQKKFDQAETLLTAALEKDPNNPTLNAQLASLYEQQGKTEQALPLAEKLHAAHPSDPAITRLLARLYSQNQEFEKAVPLYTALIATNPHDPTFLDAAGDVQIHLKNFAQAETLLKRAIADPDAFPSKEDLGQAASRLAFAASANNDPTTTLQAIIIRDRVLPQSPSSLFLEATAHDKLHHTKQATDLYKQFLAVANGQFPDEEWEVRHRLLALQHTQ